MDNGKRVGIYCAGGAAAKKYADQGFHMVREPDKTWWKIANYFICRFPLLLMLLLFPHSFLMRWEPPKDPKRRSSLGRRQLCSNSDFNDILLYNSVTINAYSPPRRPPSRLPARRTCGTAFSDRRALRPRLVDLERTEREVRVHRNHRRLSRLCWQGP